MLTKLLFWQEDWALGYHSMRLRQFPNFLISQVLSRLATREATRVYQVYK